MSDTRHDIPGRTAGVDVDPWRPDPGDYRGDLGPDGTPVWLIGRLVDVEPHATRQDRAWASGVLSTRHGLVDVVVWPAVHATLDRPLLVDTVMRVTGHVDRRDPAEPRVIARDVWVMPTRDALLCHPTDRATRSTREPRRAARTEPTP